VKKTKTLQIIESLQSFHQFGEIDNSSQMNIEWIALDVLKSGKYQPRRHFDETALQELSDSIKEHGVLQPILVRLGSNLYQDEYEIIAGERRYLAAKKAGLTSIPCIVKQIDEEKTALIALIENLQREDLNVIEEAQAFSRLKTEFSYTDDMIAQMVQKSRTTITNKMRLLKLSPQVLNFVVNQEISEGQARPLIGLEDSIQLLFADEIIKNKWSVRFLEERIQWYKQTGILDNYLDNDLDGSLEKSQAKIKELASTKQNELINQNEESIKAKGNQNIIYKTTKIQHSQDFLMLQEQLCEYLQSTVQLKLNPKTKKGKIIIDFKDLEGLQGLLERIQYDMNQI
jgi:ParB family chromosome partitioning protein